MGYNIITIIDLMLQITVIDDFKLNVTEWGGVVLTMKQQGHSVICTNLYKYDIKQVVMHTSEPYYTKKATKTTVKRFDSIYEEEKLKEVAGNSNHIDEE